MLSLHSSLHHGHFIDQIGLQSLSSIFIRYLCQRHWFQACRLHACTLHCQCTYTAHSKQTSAHGSHQVSAAAFARKVKRLVVYHRDCLNHKITFGQQCCFTVNSYIDNFFKQHYLELLLNSVKHSVSKKTLAVGSYVSVTYVNIIWGFKGLVQLFVKLYSSGLQKPSLILC